MKSRYQIQFSPSRLEAEKIRKLIQMPVTVDKEKMPYRLFTNLWNLLAIASIVSGIALLMIGYKAYSVVDGFSGLKNLGLFSFCGLVSSLACLYITFRIEMHYLYRNEEKEYSDPDSLVKVKINRKYIDNMTRGTLVRVFWQNIEECYIREEYLFIFASDGEGTVIPARVLADGEFDKLYQFVMEQIDNHKP
ncbi:YcxB family protein [Providencia hangzhouensis]|uniref:YcxB-like C-terminal domain-containing protein n=2 Tax=Providencia rettgeri TaxID=587 RepID=A0A9N8GZ92_PRORE|nr:MULTISPECIES: YcxB family protein [Providencia]MBN7841524.1 YcxB family protein [Providencia rettgeri]MBN7853870.1 YcxB family protein [Providencia rettgeri]MBN7862269.1 YcxB family protein [Providencia rettgeri]MBN7873804.1 YcxB family protein [Providencia rettgeri]MBN7897286.1 YcxB family protein [Providencia rettgeri]